MSLPASNAESAPVVEKFYSKALREAKRIYQEKYSLTALTSKDKWAQYWNANKDRLIASAIAAALIAAGLAFTGPVASALLFGGAVGQGIVRLVGAGMVAGGVYKLTRDNGYSKLGAGGIATAAAMFVGVIAPKLAHAATEAIGGIVGTPKVLTRLGTDPFVDNKHFEPGQGVVEALKDGNVTKAVNLLGDAKGWTPEQRAGYIKFFTEHRESIIAAMNGQAESDTLVEGTSVTKPTRMLMVDGPHRGGYGASEVLLVPSKAGGFFGVEVKIPTYDASGKVVGHDKFFIPRDCNNFSYLGNEPVVPPAEPPVVAPKPQLEFKPGCDCTVTNIMNVTPEQLAAAPTPVVHEELTPVSGRGIEFGGRGGEDVHFVKSIRVIETKGVDYAVAGRQFAEMWLELRTQYPNETHFLIYVDKDGDGHPETILCAHEGKDGTLEIGGLEQYNQKDIAGQKAQLAK